MIEVVGSEIYSCLDLSLTNNTEALEDNNIKINMNTKSKNRNSKVLEDILKFLKGKSYSIEEPHVVRIKSGHHICEIHRSII